MQVYKSTLGGEGKIVYTYVAMLENIDVEKHVTSTFSEYTVWYGERLAKEYSKSCTLT